MGVVVTVEELSRAISERTGMKSVESQELAQNVLNYFGFSNEILDHYLDDAQPKSKSMDSSHRSTFYDLEEAGLLKPDWEENEYFIVSKNKKNGNLRAGVKNWRIMKWRLQTDVIKNLANSREDYKMEGEVGIVDIYRKLPEEAWARAVST